MRRFQIAFILVLLTTFFVFSLSTSATPSFWLAESIGCSEARNPLCTMTFRLSTPPLVTQVTQVVPNSLSFSGAIRSSQSPTSSKSYCQIVNGVLSVVFSKGEVTSTCYFQKRDNIVVAGTSGEFPLPALVYYVQSVELVPLNGACTDPTDTSQCSATLTFPAKAEVISITTPLPLTVTCDSSDASISPSTDVTITPILNTDIAITMKRVTITVNSPATLDIVSCGVNIDKSSPLSMFFEVSKDDFTIFSADNIKLNSVSVQKASDCSSLDESVCTLSFTFPTPQDPFSANAVSAHFFFAAFDQFLVLDETYVSPAENPLETRYHQRFLKLITPTGSIPSDNGSSISQIWFQGTFVKNTFFPLYISDIIYSQPLTIDYDPLCADQYIPFCRVHYASKHIGYHLVLTLNKSPVSSSIREIVCSHNMTIFQLDHTRIHMAPSVNGAALLDTQGMTTPPEGEVFRTCYVDYLLPFNIDPVPPLDPSLLYIASAQEIYPGHPSDQRVKFPIPGLRSSNFVFDTLPFTFDLDPSCASIRQPYCSYIITIQPDPNIAYTRMDQIALPLYQWKHPNYAYGQTLSDMLKISVKNSPGMQASVSTRETFDELGYDIVYIQFSSHKDAETYDNYFTVDPNDPSQKLPVIITLWFELMPPDDLKIPEALDIWLVEYNYLAPTKPYSIMKTEVGGIFYSSLYSLGMDFDACKNEHAAFCIMTFKSLIDSVDNTIVLHSFLVSVTTDSFIDLDLDHTAMHLFSSGSLISERVLPNGSINPVLTYNFTFNSQSMGTRETIYISFAKRLGAQVLTKLEIPRYHAFVGGVWVELPLDFFYLISNINYIGDAKIQYENDCFIQSATTCSYSTQIFTNDLYPGTIIYINPPTPLSNTFYYATDLGCEGWDGVSEEQSKVYVKNVLDYTTQESSMYLATVSDALFNPTKPLHFNTAERSYVSCRFVGLKRQSYPRYYASILPKLIMNVDLRKPELSIYSISDRHNVRVVFGPNTFNLLDTEIQADCTTSHTSIVSCSTKYTVNGSTQYPLTHATANFTRSDYTKNIVNKMFLSRAEAAFQHLCAQLPTTNPPVLSEADLAILRVSPLTISDKFEIVLTEPLRTDFNDRNSLSIGNYTTYIPLCDDSLPLILNITIKEEYQNVAGNSGYHTQDYDLNLLASYTGSVLGTISPQIPFLLITNYDYYSDETLRLGNPDRNYIPTMVVGRLFEMVSEHLTVIGAANVTISFTFFNPDITRIQISSLLGIFDAKGLPCISPDYPAPIATLTTDSAAGVSYLTLNNTEYTVGTTCSFILPTTRFYPTSWFNVPHVTTVKGFSEDFHSTWSYTQYTNPAEITRKGLNEIKYLENGASSPIFIFSLILVTITAISMLV